MPDRIFSYFTTFVFAQDWAESMKENFGDSCHYSIGETADHRWRVNISW